MLAVWARSLLLWTMLRMRCAVPCTVPVLLQLLAACCVWTCCLLLAACTCSLQTLPLARPWDPNHWPGGTVWTTTVPVSTDSTALLAVCTTLLLAACCLILADLLLAPCCFPVARCSLLVAPCRLAPCCLLLADLILAPFPRVNLAYQLANSQQPFSRPRRQRHH